MRDVMIRDATIRLGQLLKLTGLAGSGAEAKELLRQGRVCVNGELEVRRGRQLHHGDRVEAVDESLRVVGLGRSASGESGSGGL